MNVEQAATHYFTTHDKSYVKPEGNNRLLCHDSFHALLNLPETYKNEFIVAIYQAVLMDSAYVGTGKRSTNDLGRDNISLSDIFDSVVPGVEKFLEDVEQKNDIRINRSNGISDVEIALYYSQALQPRVELEKHFGPEFLDFTGSNFFHQDFDILEPIFRLGSLSLELPCL